MRVQHWARFLAVLAVLGLLLGACGTNTSDGGGEEADADEETATSDDGDGGGEATEDGDGGGDDGEAAGADDWEPEWVDGVLQPLPDGFPEEPITLMTAFDTGAPDGVYARTMQQALQDLSPVGVRVEERPMGPMIQFAAIRFLESQPGGTEGYWSVVAAMTGAGLKVITEPVGPELGLELADLNPLIATEIIPFALVSRPDAPWDTYEEMVAYAQENPGEVRYISWVVGNQLDIAMTRLMELDNFTTEKIPLSELPQVPLTVAAGEGDIAVVAAGAALPLWESGDLDVLMTIGSDTSPPGWEDIPTDRDFGYEEPWSSIRGLLVHPDTPSLRERWLFELYSAAAESDVYRQRIEAEGAEAVELGHDELMEILTNTIEGAEPIVRDLGLHFEDR